MSSPQTACSKLPAEVPGYIFEECIEDSDEDVEGGELGVSPWLLAQVCRFWYQTVKGTPSLWRRILVTDCSYTYWEIKRNKQPQFRCSFLDSSPGLVRSHSAMQVCLDSADLASALERTGAAPLEITMAFIGRSDASEDESPPSFYQGMYDQIFNHRILPRISHLAFDSNGRDPWDIEMWNGQELDEVSLLSGSLPNLISLHILSFTSLKVKVKPGIPLLTALLESAKKLKEIYVGRQHIPDTLRYDSWKSSSYRVTISNLKKLRIPHTGILDAMLGGSLGIEELVLEGPKLDDAEDLGLAGSWWDIRAMTWPTLDTPGITFERLTRLHLISDDFCLLDQLKFPLLTELRLTPSCKNRSLIRKYPNGHPPLGPNFTLELPQLQALHVSSPNLAPLNRFDMPQLKTLHLTSTRLTQGKADADFTAFISAPGAIPPRASFFDGVQNLYINSLMSEKGSVSTLEAFSSLQALHLVPGKKMGKSLVPELIVTKYKHDAARVICPVLKTIELDCFSFREWDKLEGKDMRVGTVIPDGFHDLLAKLVESRKKWGHQLEYCALTEMDGSKNEYA